MPPPSCGGRRWCAALESVAAGVEGDGELSGVALPDVLLIVVVLGRDDDAIGDEEGGVEADAELSDQILLHGGILGVHELVEELGGAGARDGAEVVDHILLGHADAGVGDVDDVILLVGP